MTKYISQKQVDWADIIIFAKRRHLGLAKKKFNIKGKKILVLHVSDSKKSVPDELAHLRELSGREFNKKWTYPHIRNAISKHLPLKK